jgi:hypothetical protein
MASKSKVNQKMMSNHLSHHDQVCYDHVARGHGSLMKQKMTSITLKNDHDPEPFHDLQKRGVHPLAASIASNSRHIVQIPAWIDAIANRVAMKAAFLEIIKPD